jgi:outer membrane lipoprotein SlyB
VKKLFATISLAATLTACAMPYTPHEFSFSGLSDLGSIALGTIESVRVVRIARDIHAFEDALELRMQPDLRDELVILLDDGRAVSLMAKATQRFEAGQRVRVVSDTYSPYGPRVEHE